MSFLKLKIDNYAVHYDEYDGYGFNSIIDMEILGSGLGLGPGFGPGSGLGLNEHFYGEYISRSELNQDRDLNLDWNLDGDYAKKLYARHLGQYNGIKHKPSEKNIVVKKSEEFDDEIFDIYNLKLDEKYIKELEQEMKSKIEIVKTKNKINIPKLKINVNDDILLTKEQVKSIREGKIILNPYVRFKYGTTKTNRDVELEVVTSLELNIGISIEREKENIDTIVEKDYEKVNQTYLELFMNWMYNNIINLLL